jgi:hypothetical protein
LTSVSFPTISARETKCFNQTLQSVCSRNDTRCLKTLDLALFDGASAFAAAEAEGIAVDICDPFAQRTPVFDEGALK